jgi:hypothetical protein
MPERNVNEKYTDECPERIKIFMKRDVLGWAEGRSTNKLISKETLNHRGLIEMVSGLDVYQHTAEAYRRTYSALGIDIINRVPLENAPAPTSAGTTRPHPARPYHLAPLGVYDTVSRHTYLCGTPEEVWDLDMAAIDYEDLLVPVPHPCAASDITAREVEIGDIGLYYPMLYTTLFMWPVETLGWEVFMLAAISEQDRFHEHFLLPCVQKSKAINFTRRKIMAKHIDRRDFLKIGVVTAGTLALSGGLRRAEAAKQMQAIMDKGPCG